MASIGQLKLPDNNNYNLSVPFVIGTGSTAGTWLGTLTGLTAYYDGLLILYKPSVAGASTTTLNLNSLGAKTCYINNATKLTTHFPVNQPILLAYSKSQNSGCWMCIDNYWANSVPSATCGTAAATAEKTASCDFYMANANSYVHIVMRYSNTSKTALTLNINSRGAKPIYINGTASSASNYTLPAGSYIIFYDGTNYYFRTDGKLTANITGNAGTVGGHTVAKDVPSNAKFTDTTYESKSAASGGTDVSLCTTGEKYTWNAKLNSSGAITRDTLMPSTTTYSVDNLHGGTRFVYSTHGTPYAGTMVSFDSSDSNNYGLQLSSSFSLGRMWFRTRNGDTNTWHNWIEASPRYEYDAIGTASSKTYYIPLEMRGANTAQSSYLLTCPETDGGGGLYFLRPNASTSKMEIYTIVAGHSTVTQTADTWGFVIRTGGFSTKPSIIRL